MRLFNKTALSMAVLGLISVGATTNVLANNHHKHHKHEQVRQAFATGQVMSLKDVLSKAEQEFPGEVIEIEFEKGRNDNFVYDIKMLREDGNLMKLKVDATNADVLKTKTRGERRKDMGNRKSSMRDKGQNMDKNHQRMNDNHKRMGDNHNRMNDNQQRMGDKQGSMRNKDQNMDNQQGSMRNKNQGPGNKQGGNMGNNSRNN